MWIVDLLRCDALQEGHPILHSTFDHDHAVFLELPNLLLGQGQSLWRLSSHHSSRKCHIWHLGACLQFCEVDGLGGNARGLSLLRQTAYSIQCHAGTSNCQSCVAEKLRLLQLRKQVWQLNVKADGDASEGILARHACEGKHRQASILELLVLLLGKLERLSLRATLSAAEAKVSCNLVLVHKQTVATESLQNGHELHELPDFRPHRLRRRVHFLEAVDPALLVWQLSWEDSVDDDFEDCKHCHSAVHKLRLPVPSQAVEVEAEVANDLVHVVICTEPKRIEA
mmetsp:Transcript_16761/g.29375  ORF Transcript_16761/g.29375 Transcript_16761/m.29375 type:complete len:283 (-) Transcript_16761:422-1270(-)